MKCDKTVGFLKYSHISLCDISPAFVFSVTGQESGFTKAKSLGAHSGCSCWSHATYIYHGTNCTYCHTFFPTA